MPKAGLTLEFLEVLREMRRLHRCFWGQSMPVRPNEMMLLLVLHHHLEKDCLGLQPSELGRMLRLTRPTVSSLVNSLEGKGYVERMNDEEDRRVVFVRLTSKATKLVKDGKGEVTRNVSRILDCLGERDTRELIRIMRKISNCPEINEMSSDRSRRLCGD